jgi:hypothetical protein
VDVLGFGGGALGPVRQLRAAVAAKVAPKVLLVWVRVGAADRRVRFVVVVGVGGALVPGQGDSDVGWQRRSERGFWALSVSIVCVGRGVEASSKSRSR